MRQYKKIEKFSFDESCEHNCGSKFKPLDIPLPNCKTLCYTTSEEEGALGSCEIGCGNINNPTNVPLPKCLQGCYTSNIDSHMCLFQCYNKNNESCKKYCAGSEPLPKCKEYCYTTSEEKNALESCE